MKLKDIQIRGHKSHDRPLQRFLSENLGYHAVVITDSGCRFPDEVVDKSASHLHLIFDDIAAASKSLIFVTPVQVKQALDYAVGKEHLVIACHAGISRSSALAFLIALQEWNKERAFAVLTPRVHYPNPAVIRTGLEILGRMDILPELAAWQNSHAWGCRLSAASL